jgi:hypothetical protein
VETLQTGSSADILDLLKELGMGQEEQIQLSRKCRKCFKEWDRKRQEIDWLMKSDELAVWTGGILRNAFRNQGRLRDYRGWDDVFR